MPKPSLRSRLIRRASCALLVALCAGSISGRAGAIVQPPSADPCAGCDHGAPYFDVRLRDDGFPTRAISSAINTARASDTVTQRQAALDRLHGRIAGLEVDEDPFFGTPRFVRSTQRLLTGASDADGLRIVSEFIADSRALFEIDPGEVTVGRVSRDYRTAHNGARHLTIQQQRSGVDLFGCELRANLSRAGELINISSTMLPRPEGDFVVPDAKVEDFAAIIAAAQNVGVVLTELPVPATDPKPADQTLERTWRTHPDLRHDEPVVTRRVYFPIDRASIRPAWSVVIPVKGVGNTYEIIVDAADGAILHRHNRLVWESTQPVTTRVYTSDGVAPGSPGTSTPTGFQFPLATRTLVTVNPVDVIPWSPNGWIDDGGTETIGNNVDAHTDLTNDNIADSPRPSGGVSRVFDFPLDPSLEPENYRDAAVTQMFYFCNRYHDRLMALGFDEAAGNFQQINFTAQGVGGDRVLADVHDSASNAPTSTNRNNANFSTSGADGSTGRVQMYLFTGPAPDRDGTLDGDIVYHELTHGTSIRLHGGLSGTQPGGMGEGWSDFVGISLLSEAADDPNAVYCTGGYTTLNMVGGYTSNYYFGIRRYPYSTDLSKNPLTFADIDPGQFNVPDTSVTPRGPLGSTNAAAVHNVGEVWCMMLMECRAALWPVHGPAANNIMLQLVIDGMKISPGNPTFIQARDAIIQADLVNNNGANLSALWTAFAKRGLGSGATSPASSTTTGVVESYIVPQFASFTYPDGRPNPLAPQAASTFRVNVAGTLLDLTPGSGAMHLSVNGGAFTLVDLTDTANPNEYTATLPALPCLSTVAYYFATDTSVGPRTDPPGAPGAVYRAVVATGVAPQLADSFESDTGWTVGPNTAITGLWVRSDPVGTAAQPENARTGSLCFVTGNGAVGGAAGDADVDGGQTTLLSPSYNLSAASDAVISYWRWYSNGTGSGPFADTFRVDVSNNNGASWTNAETIGPGSIANPDTIPGWRFASWRLSAIGLSPTAQVRVRFIAEDVGTGSIVEAAIDDFSIETATCTEPTPPCPADFNGVGGVTIDDLFLYINAYFVGCP